MRFRVLGTLEIRVGQGWVRLERPRRRAVLAYLLLAPNRAVTVGELIEAIWGALPPSTARSQIQNDVAAIRKALLAWGQAETIVTTTGGYKLVSAAGHTDYQVFRRLVGEATAFAGRTNWAAASRKLSEAVALWQGTALADVAAAFAEPARAALEEQRLDAIERLAEARINVGYADEQIPVLREVVAAQPERERPAVLLMLALHRTGRRTEALAVARGVRTYFRVHHGLDPSQTFIDTERSVFVGSDSVDATPPGLAETAETSAAVSNGAASAVQAVPRSWLPRSPNGFIGRDGVVERLIRHVDEVVHAGESLVWMIDGMPGIGKTTLAVHAARLVKDRYPDAQLFIDLQGHAEASARKTSVVLRMLLGQLGFPTAALPPGAEGRAALWRDELSRRRCVVVLDNAASSEQIETLLPDAPGSLVIVTSRRRLTNTTAAWSESLPVLTGSEGIQMLAGIAGHGRVGAEPEAAAQIVELCGHHPLALRLAGARVSRRTSWSLADLAARLRNGSALSYLSAEDRTVTAAFSTSYEKLTVGAQNAFRVIGALPVDDVTAYTVAAATDGAVEQSQQDLDELADANLLVEHDVERYRLHDLMKSYAASLANAIDPAEVRTGWIGGCYDYYAAASALSLSPGGASSGVFQYFETAPTLRRELTPADPGPGWFAEEQANLLTLIRSAPALGRHERGGQLAMAVWRHLYNNSAVEEIVETQTIALEVARALVNDSLASAAHNYLASGYFTMGKLGLAERHLREALEIRRGIGDWSGFYVSQGNLATVYLVQGRMSAAARLLEEAIARDSTLDMVPSWLSMLGKTYAELGQSERALRTGRTALFLARQTTDLRRLLTALAVLGETRLRAGQPAPALRILRLCLALHQRQRNFDAVDVLNDLGNVYRELGMYDQAERHHRQALEASTSTRIRHVSAKIFNDLAYTLIAFGKPGAIEAFEQALQLAAAIGNEGERARASHGMAICLIDEDPEQARQHLKVALTLFEQEAPEQQDVARRLTHLDQGGSPALGPSKSGGG
ncbi:SARP family transcriptional regulator [Asanoa ishikariensis]|uniref:DNA-binding transcriptional activator of the SARP family n=2 Tax=Asanoa ishikariensis TaxID=137265 RepID=A0A1H3TLK1_9ACTN|nr:SARP family transcriptional regulator [Asanoa ishikariensis]SDZ50990.1 DNA-binding transcriptional activator of the SARP family [Asanoa ishikariensis]